jgi:mono/diheme cytochrome c family protein
MRLSRTACAGKAIKIASAGRKGLLLAFLVFGHLMSGSAAAVGPTEGVEVPRSTGYGLATAKRANCMSCHKWHGDGGPGYGGAAISLRKTQLNREQLIQTILCGRPGAGMPYFDRQAYKQKACYEMTFDDFTDDPDHKPMPGKKFLNERQVNAVADFIVNELQGQPLSKEYCEMFYSGPTRQCESLESGAQ